MSAFCSKTVIIYVQADPWLFITFVQLIIYVCVLDFTCKLIASSMNYCPLLNVKLILVELSKFAGKQMNTTNVILRSQIDINESTQTLLSQQYCAKWERISIVSR